MGNEVQEQFEVLRVLDERKVSGKTEFFVKWKDGPKDKWSLDEWDEWLPEDSVNCPDLIQEFREKRLLATPAKEDRTSSTAGKRTDKSSKKSASKGRKTAKKEDEEEDTSRRDKKKRKSRAYIASDEEEEESKKRAEKKGRKKRAIDSSDEEDEEKGESRSNSRSRSKTTESREDESASRRNQRDKKRTGRGDSKDAQGPSTSRRDSEDIPCSSKAFLAPSTPTLKMAKTEPMSAEKGTREPQSAVTNDTELNKFKGRYGEKIAPAREKAYNKAEKLERQKTKSNSKRPKARLPDPPRAYDDGEVDAKPLFSNSPLKTPKGEIMGDSSGMEEGPTFDDLEDKEEEAPQQPQLLAVKTDTERAVETPQSGSTEYEESDAEVADDEDRDKTVEMRMEEGEEDRAHGSIEDNQNGPGAPPGDEMEDDSEEGRLVIDEGEEAGDEPMGEGEEHPDQPVNEDDLSDDDDDLDLGNLDDPIDCPNELNIDVDPQDPMGYDLGMEGRIIGYEVFGFDNGAEDTFCCVHFPALGQNQWIQKDTVKEKDPHGFDSFVRDLYEEQERKAIHRGAKQYRAERRRLDRLGGGGATEE